MVFNDEKSSNNPGVPEKENTSSGDDLNAQNTPPEFSQHTTEEQEIAQKEEILCADTPNHPASTGQVITPDTKSSIISLHEGNSPGNATVTYGKTLSFGRGISVSEGISFAQLQKTFDEVSHTPVTLETLRCVYATILKFGCLTREQIKSILPKNAAPDTDIEKTLTAVPCAETLVYFHNQNTIAAYATLSKQPIKKIKSKAVFMDMMGDLENLHHIIHDTDILLSFNQQGGKKYRLFDWISSINPRSALFAKTQNGKTDSSDKAEEPDKPRSPMRIPRTEKGEYLEPHLVVVLETKDTYIALIFDEIADSPWLSLNEEQNNWESILTDYDRWLNAPDRVKRWLKKNLFYIKPEHIGVALYLSSSEPKTFKKMMQYCRDQEITSPIYIALSREDIISNPFGCLTTNCAKEAKWI